MLVPVNAGNKIREPFFRKTKKGRGVMNFFISDVHGAAKEYFTLKERIGLKKNDNLYVLGDILDGNNANPSACVEILDDVMKNDNVKLILGDHEYWHVMHFLSNKGGEEESVRACREQLYALDYTGKPLLRYFLNSLTGKEYERYMSYLLFECEMTDFIKIGDFSLYLVHSSPCLCRDPDIWQKDVTDTPLLIDHDYAQEIDSDPNMKVFLGKDPSLRVGKSIIIAGGEPVRRYCEEDPKLMEAIIANSVGIKKQKVIAKGKKTIINCGCDAGSIGRITNGWESDLACLMIDAAGFNVIYLSESADQ